MKKSAFLHLPGHDCIDQLTRTNAAFKLGVEIMTVAEIVAGALVLDNPHDQKLTVR